MDILFIGSSIYAGKIDAGLRRFLEQIPAGAVKKAVVFGTSAGKKSALAEIRGILVPKGIQVSNNEFHCKGSFLFAHRGRPNTDDIESAKTFAEKIVTGGQQ